MASRSAGRGWHAETYNKTRYPQVLAKLTPVIAGTYVETYETASTYLPV